MAAGTLLASPVGCRSVTAPVIPGAEPYSAVGDGRGALVLHGFTGNPQSVRGLALALADAGLHRGDALAPRPRDGHLRHARHTVGALVRRRRGGLHRARGAQRRRRGRGPLHGRDARRVAGRAPSRDRGAGRRQPAALASGRGHRVAHRGDDRGRRRGGTGYRLGHRPGGRGRVGLPRAAAARGALALRGGGRGGGWARVGHLPRARLHQPAGPRRRPEVERAPGGTVQGPGRAGGAGAQLPRGHPRPRQGRDRGAHGRVRDRPAPAPRP